MDKNSIRKVRRRMDYETAIAFAFGAFENLHARTTWPEWLFRCTTESCGLRKDDANYYVKFTFTYFKTKQPVIYFEAAVNPLNAHVTVLIDRDPSEFIGEELAEFEASSGNPWSSP